MLTFATFHTYPGIGQGGRLAKTVWEGSQGTAKEAVEATLGLDDQAIILLAQGPSGRYLRGYAPGGMGVI